MVVAVVVELEVAVPAVVEPIERVDVVVELGSNPDVELIELDVVPAVEADVVLVAVVVEEVVSVVGVVELVELVGSGQQSAQPPPAPPPRQQMGAR